MAQYRSKAVVVSRPAQYIVDRFADLSSFASALDSMSDDDRKRVGDVRFSKDSITIDTRQVGVVSFNVTERSADRVVMSAVGSPVPLSLSVNLSSKDDCTTEIVTAIDVEIPAMLRPMIGGAMQKAVDQFGELMVKLNA